METSKHPHAGIRSKIQFISHPISSFLGKIQNFPSKISSLLQETVQTLNTKSHLMLKIGLLAIPIILNLAYYPGGAIPVDKSVLTDQVPEKLLNLSTKINCTSQLQPMNFTNVSLPMPKSYTFRHLPSPFMPPTIVDKSVLTDQVPEKLLNLSTKINCTSQLKLMNFTNFSLPMPKSYTFRHLPSPFMPRTINEMSPPFENRSHYRNGLPYQSSCLSASEQSHDSWFDVHLPSLSQLEKIIDIFPEGLVGDGVHILWDLSLSTQLLGVLRFPSVDFKTHKLLFNLIAQLGSLLTHFLPSQLDVTARKGTSPLPLLNTVVDAYGLIFSNFLIEKKLLNPLVHQVVSIYFSQSIQALYYGYALQKSSHYLATNPFSILGSVKNSFIGLAGLHGMISTFIQGIQLYRGLQLLPSLNDIQRKEMLKHHAISHIAKEKQCNAVIIDGASSEWGELSDDIPFPVGELLYEKCNTQAYRVMSDRDLCDTLKKAKDHFGFLIDILSFHGHANGNHMILNRDYRFTATEESLTCIDQSVKQEAEIFLFGCNTATRDHSSIQLSLTERIAEKLHTRKVTGIEAYLYAAYTMQSVSKNSLSFKTYLAKNYNYESVFGNFAVSYQNGKKLEG